MEQKSVNKYTLGEYVSYLFIMTLLVTTTWLLGLNDLKLLRYWFAFVMTSLLIIRIPDFRKKKYHHFLSEMCYFVNIFSIIISATNIDIRVVYPFLHGPLLVFAITSADAFIPHDISRTISFAVHTFGTVIFRKIYWNSDPSRMLNFYDLKSWSFKYYMQTSIALYLVWFIPYSIYLFSYNGNSLTMLRWTLKLKPDETITLKTKLKYLFGHMTSTTISLVLGIILMHFYWLDCFAVGMQILSGLVQGGYYYYSGGKKLRLNTFF